MMKENSPRLSAEEWAEKKNNEKKSLFDMTASALSEIVQDGEKFEKYLDVQSRFDRYSVSNALLIYRQFPKAVQLKTFEDWAKENVSIKKGVKSISILEPADYVKKDGSKAVGYHVKKMFDVSQTKGNAPAEIKTELRTLIAVMLDTSPAEVEAMDTLLYSDSRAFYDPKINKLCIKRNTGDSLLLCQSVAYELGQAELALDDPEHYSRTELQFPARCIGYMLCRKYGVDAKAFAVNQIPEDWKNKDSKEIKALLTRIHEDAHHIYSRTAEQIYRGNSERKKHSKEQER